MDKETLCVEQAGVQVLDARTPDETHVHLHLVLEELHGPLDAFLSIGAHGVQKGPSDAHALGTQTQGLDDVCCTTDAAVDEDFNLVLEAAGAQDGHGLGENLDAGSRSVELTAAVVGQDDAVNADLDCAEHVFHALHALEDDGHLGDAPEPRDVLPAERGVDEAGDGARGSLRCVCFLARLDIAPLVGELGAHVLLAAAELGRVDGDEESLAAAGLGVLDYFARDLAVLVHVELQPLDLVASLGVDDFVKRARRERGNHLDHVVLVRGSREDYFALWVAQLSESRGRDVEGDGARRAQHRGAKVDFFNID